jgi:probable O-glycosylation ligase (exosortase A-associated)
VRDLVLLGAMLMFVPLAFTQTYLAYLLWGWAGLISLTSYLYGFMWSVPYVQLFALITMAAVLLKRDPLAQRFEFNPTTNLFAVFVVHGFFCALLAYPGLERNWELWGNVAKTVLFCVCMPMLATSRLRIHALVVVIAISTSFHGALDGLKFIASGGGHHAQTIPKFGDNNHLALVLLMVVPLLFYLFQYSSKKLIRLGFAGSLFLTVLAVVATNSRGGLLGLLAVAFWTVIRSRRKLMGVLFIVIGGLLVTQLAPESWSERMGTIQEADADASFMGRVTAWKVTSAIAVENPVFGGGFRAVQSHPVWDQFKYSQGFLGFIETPILARSGVAAHSIWFEVMGDLGFVGFFIFVALLVNSFLIRRDIWKLVRANGERLRWAGDLSDALGAAMFVYLVSGSLLSAAYFELPYILMMLMQVVKLQALKDVRSVPLAASR